jgi:putative transcriptional regulator
MPKNTPRSFGKKEIPVKGKMLNILRNRSQSMKFQIMVEIASRQPDVQQKDVAEKLGLTNQAISEYFQELVKTGWIVSAGRSKYRLTKEGVNWLLQAYLGLMEYASEVGKALTGITVCAAIADRKIKEGQKVGLIMRDGLLYATSPENSESTGTAVQSADRGEDVGITSIEGLIEFERGKLRLILIPTAENGGSRGADLNELQRLVVKEKIVGSLGLEAYACLKKVGRRPDYLYGVIEAAVEAANSGLDFCIVFSEDYYPFILSRLHEAELEYEVYNLSR